MAKSLRSTGAEDRPLGSKVSTSLLASLDPNKKLDFDDRRVEEDPRIQGAIRILEPAGSSPVASYAFNHYICGPYSDAFEDALAALDLSEVIKAEPSNDGQVARVRAAIQEGDDFPPVLVNAVPEADSNRCISKAKASDMVSYIGPELADVTEAASDFAEAMIWSK